MKPYHPRLPHILVGPHPGGGFVVRDTRTGASVYAGSEGAVAAAAAGMSAAPGHYGLGDVIAGATARLGLKGTGPCTPCARRQAQLNGLMPRFWRR